MNYLKGSDHYVAPLVLGRCKSEILLCPNLNKVKKNISELHNVFLFNNYDKGLKNKIFVKKHLNSSSHTCPSWKSGQLVTERCKFESGFYYVGKTGECFDNSPQLILKQIIHELSK